MSRWLFLYDQPLRVGKPEIGQTHAFLMDFVLL